MTATIAPHRRLRRRALRRPTGSRWRAPTAFELVKLLAQWRVRLLILACWIGPGLLVVAVSQQASLPADTLFGPAGCTPRAGPERWWWLGFAGNWVLLALPDLGGRRRRVLIRGPARDLAPTCLVASAARRGGSSCQRHWPCGHCPAAARARCWRSPAWSAGSWSAAGRLPVSTATC